MWALVNNKEIIKFPYTRMDLKKDNPGVSFPKEMGESILSFYDVKVVKVDQTVPEYNATTEKIETNEIPEWDGEDLVVKNKVVSKTADELQEDFTVASQKAKAKRDRLLSDSDWIVVFSAEKQQEVPLVVREYRQKLRDLSFQEGFPFNVVWPEKPEELK